MGRSISTHKPWEQRVESGVSMLEADFASKRRGCKLASRCRLPIMTNVDAWTWKSPCVQDLELGHDVS